MTTVLLKQTVPDNAAFLTEEEKIEEIALYVSSILKVLGLDLENESLRDTPMRVAKMYVEEIFSGLNPELKPKITLFENTSGYKEMLVEKNITFFSYCEHHLVPFFGVAHVAYFPQKHIVGLSKINRLVQFLARKPQVQERLTSEVGRELQRALRTNDVAVVLEAQHLCIAARGVEDSKSTTRTSFFSGKFTEKEIKDEYLRNLES